MDNTLLKHIPTGIHAKDLLDLLININYQNWVFTSYFLAYSDSREQAEGIYQSLTRAFENNNFPDSKKIKLKNSTNIEVVISTIDKELLLDYLVLKNFQEKIETIEAHGKTSDLNALNKLIPLSINVVNNIKFLDQKDFIKNYEKNVRNSLITNKFGNGSTYCCFVNEDELNLTLSVLNTLKGYDKSARELFVSFIKDLNNFPKLYQHLKYKTLTYLLASIEINGECSDSLYKDIQCIILDFIDNSVIREQHEDEENKVYSNYRHRKIDSIYNHQ
jgi:hypothetical protein